MSRKTNEGSSAQKHPTLTQLQKQVGNQAALQLMKNQNMNATRMPWNGRSSQTPIVQLMPTRKQVEGKIGEPIEGESTRYRPVLDSLDTLNQYLDTTLVREPGGMDEQKDRLIDLYKDLEIAANTYITAKKTGKKVKYMKKTLLPTIARERVGIVQTIARYKRNPPSQMPKLWIITGSGDYKSHTLTDDMLTGEIGKGGMNSVAFFTSAYQEEGVFKETKNTIKKGSKKMTKAEKEAADTEYAVSEVAGIDHLNARLAERNVAMSRLDQLLGAGVIAHTEFALRKKGGGDPKKGSFMVKAKGKGIGKYLNSDQVVKGAPQKEGKSAKTIRMDDPTLQRCLSRLQLLDTLAMQVDRNKGNYFIKRDKEGNVLSVTGIDNDMAFGTRTDIYSNVEQYPGVSQYVDKELAERIIALKDNELTAVMEDLLTTEEIDSLLTRLHALQAHLQQEQTRLLAPDEWNEATAKGMLDEEKVIYNKQQLRDNPNLKKYGSYHGSIGRWIT
jgi:hypothetical protein